MQIFLIEPREIKLPSGAVVKYPAGWSGSVPDEHGEAWCAEGAAQPLDSDAPVPVLSPRRVHILGQLADAIDAQAAAAAAPSGDTAGEEVKLEDLTVAELKEVAAGAGVTLPARVTKAQIVELLNAKAAENAAASQGQA